MGPNRPLDEIPGDMLPQEMLVTLGKGGNFNSLPLGTKGDLGTRLLWTIDERGVNFIPEQTPWETSRKMVSHTNISEQAYAGGEAWRTGENEIVINSHSGAFGRRSSRPETLAEGEARYNLAIQAMKDAGLKVTARPYGE